ncbi:S24 family peptidase [Empedobacter falsenii]|uniref:S24 family peptidase n=1 Tax=Empedobacter falsenii TaxID=343874 RepID=UPI0025771083|nr:S24 family peptidase [Empedobacter falsenii]MDM1548746.1 S24 family peptidase [Empedobacter falsenii]
MDLPIENQRVQELIDLFCDGNRSQFSKEINVSQPRINRLFNLDNRSDKYPIVTLDILQAIVERWNDVNFNWLAIGELPRLKSKNNNMLVEEATVVTEPSRTYRKTKDKLYEFQKVPVYNLDATMGLVPMMNDNGVDEDKIIDYISIPNLPSCDGATPATGDSMYPLLKAGDLIAYKRVPIEPNSLFYGEIYLLSIKIDETSTYKTIKYVQKSDLGSEYLRLVSQNQHHPPMDIEIKQIAAIALVRASIRIHN